VTEDGGTRGRPRDPEVTAAILDAAARMLGDVGYARMSIEAVAKAAGVGKTAIYRRYRDKAALAAAAMARLRRPDALLDTGDARAAFVEQMERSRRTMVEGPGMVMLGTLLVEGRRDPALLAAFRERLIEPLRAAGRRAIDQGIERGEIRSDVDADAALEAMWGQLVARSATGLPFTDDWAERAVEVVWRGIAAPAGGRGRHGRRA